MPRSCSLLVQPITHSQIVKHYVAHHGPALATELAWFAQKQPIPAAISRVALALGPSHKRLSHQRRLYKSVIPIALSQLQAASTRLFAVHAFVDLYSEVVAAIGAIPGAGSLYTYDTALRLGAFRRLKPSEVYLQAGAREGAKKILSSSSNRSVPLSQFPTVFHSLAPHEMENLLCLYHECI